MSDIDNEYIPIPPDRLSYIEDNLSYMTQHLENISFSLHKDREILLSIDHTSKMIMTIVGIYIGVKMVKYGLTSLGCL